MIQIAQMAIVSLHGGTPINKIMVNKKGENLMSALSEKYYGKKKVAIVLSKAGFLNNAFSDLRNKNGYFDVCDGSVEFKGFLPKPGVDKSDDLSEPDYYFDSYEEVKEFGINAFVIDAKTVYSNDSDSVKKFNDVYLTNFNSFDEIYDYAASDGRWTDNNEYEDYGLGFSANVVEDFRLTVDANRKENIDSDLFEESELDDSDDIKSFDINNNVAVLYEADDCETVYGVLDADFAEEIRSATRHFDYPVACFEATDSKPPRDGNYYVFINNDVYDVVGLFSSEDSMREYICDNNIEDYQFFICPKNHFLGCDDEVVGVIEELRKTTDFKDVDIVLHLPDEDDEIDYEFERVFYSEDKNNKERKEKEMRLFYIYDEDDIEGSYGLFDNEEAAQFVCERIEGKADSPAIKEFEIGDKSENGVYYFVINSNENRIEDECFINKDSAIGYCDNEGILPYEIHGHKINSICSGNDSLDENGEIIEPDEDDREYSFYDLAKEMKENDIEFEYFEQDYAEGGW